MEKIIAVKDGGTEFLTNPQIIYNLNLGHLLVKFKSIQATNRNTAFAVYLPAQKELVLIAGHKGFVIKSFEQFQLTMKQQILIDITITAKDLNQILIVDGQDNLRFATVNEDILLYAKSTPYAHLFKNIFDKIVQKEKDILGQFYEMKNFCLTITNTRPRGSVLELLLGQSTGM